MKQYRFKIGNKSNIALFENDDQAKEFAEFIGAEWEVDTYLFRLNVDNMFCAFELEIDDIEKIELFKSFDFKKVNIWELPKKQ